MPIATQAELDQFGSNLFGDPEVDTVAAGLLPHHDLQREEAEDLAEGVFGDVIDQPNEILPTDNISAYRSNHVAVTEELNEDGRPTTALLTSTFPLRAENSDGVTEPVSLDLMHAEGALQPMNPVVSSELPTNLEEGVSLPEVDTDIYPLGLSDTRSPTILGESTAFYPNVSAETDLLIAPTPTGVETFSQLRSPAAPTSQSYAMDLPAGAELVSTGLGGAEVVKNGEILIVIPPPTAVDANGIDVPTSMAVTENRITVSIDADSTVRYPVLVDPIFESYYWDQYPGSWSPEWYPDMGYLFQAGWNFWKAGMSIYNSVGWPQFGEQGSFNYYVPRFFSDAANPEIAKRPLSYIKEIRLWDLWFAFASNRADPHLQIGLWSEEYANWVSLKARWGYEGQLTDPYFLYRLINPNEVTDAKNGGVALAAFEFVMEEQRRVVVGMAEVEISDKDNPSLGSLKAPTEWLGSTPKPITYTSADPGLGIFEVKVWQPRIGNPAGVTSRLATGCLGSARSPCPAKQKSAQVPLIVDPSQLPEGEVPIKLNAIDPIAHESGWATALVRVDHTAPVIKLSGSLTEPAQLAAMKPSYQLNVSATDGSESGHQSGAAMVETFVDGKEVDHAAPGCPTEDCGVMRSWTFNPDQYAIGVHKVEVRVTDAAGNIGKSTLSFTSHPDLAAPVATLSGTMTEQAAIGTSRRTYLLKAVGTDPGAAEERKSGVAAVAIKVDGTTVSSASPGCVAGGCSLTRETTISSSSYAVGSHSATVTVTDAAGHVTSRSVTFAISRDTSAPTIAVEAPMYTAPGGWVEQRNYTYSASATDNGYGLKSLVLKVDGQVVSAKEQACSAGGCSVALAAGTVNFANYLGGAHPAELVATDWAGNAKKRGWTINVVPKGVISDDEAEATIEAVEETSPVNIIGPPESEAGSGYEGTGPGLSFGVEESEFVSEGADAPGVVSPDASEGLAVEVPTAGALSPGCSEPVSVDPGSLSAADEEARAKSPQPTCKPEEGGGAGPIDLEPVEITPILPEGAEPTVALSEDAYAAVSSSQGASVDQITRPLFDGLMTFTTIRDKTAAQEFSWKVDLASNQELKLIDPQHAGIYYNNGLQSFSITAIPAHDAVGTAVPTHLTVTSGDILTLVVEHRNVTYIYPVNAGAGWEGGFQTFEIEMPPPTNGEEAPTEEEGEAGTGQDDTKVPSVKIMTSGPPVLLAANSASDLKPTSAPRYLKRFKFTYCVPHNNPNDPVFDGHLADSWFNVRAGQKRVQDIEGLEGKNLPKIISECHREDFEGVYWGVSTYGTYRYIPQQWVWLRPGDWDCHKWGEEQPAKQHCKALATETPVGVENAVHGPISVIGEYRFPPMQGQWVGEVRAACFTQGGQLFPTSRVAGEPVQRPMIWHNEYKIAGLESCDWR